MNVYIGTKIIQAEPEPRQGQPGYRVRYEDGYESWSPAAVFERSYRELTGNESALAAHDKLSERAAAEKVARDTAAADSAQLVAALRAEIEELSPTPPASGE